MPPPPPVQSLTRGLAVISSFGTDRPRQTVAQVAESTGLARATARRFLHTLVEEGYADTDGSLFWLTPKTLELGYSYLSSLGLPEIAQPHLEKLAHTVDESCSLSILDHGDVLYVGRVPIRRIMAVSITIGTRFPAYATSMGRVLLADRSEEEIDHYLKQAPFEALTPKTLTTPNQLESELARVKNQGYSLVDQELELGLRSVAAPVRDSNGTTVAAVNISTPAAAHTPEFIINNFIPALKSTCATISTDIHAAHLERIYP
ncbi:IclR family transcriptional regulator domain-containing protein [Corynebacterium cystitidis]|uniref:Transcriptional regulator, IclR family n=1 Tax=Corynebacterium cystitidis DSM 20524 TaxID=1121357 RepID=A0A1H9SPX9_9CORY|nr:IclR family transcriptional regulator C-terminal domain-containing protein [Corynebacterium cystitidis]WJY83133.1 Pca regulon regulatory protein [Corynebacterium cystitidis DSM 20524]SER87072.1 transcriptional regulator, IclR family [Corynebacterium cystitidis DSM 20524]SNV66625.1 transcriptional regulator [Corynebacterium cystitidis]